MKSYFKDKRLLVTGATGFIGSHLCRRLLELDAEVHILSREDSDQFRIRDILGNLIIWYGDLRNYTSIKNCIKNSKPQVIFHLAAFKNVRRDLELIEPMIEINLKGTLNILKGIIEEKVPVEIFVNTGTSEEYGNGSTPFQENQRERPVSPYSASKVANTYFSQMIYRTFNVPIVTLRPFLTYGPYQDADMFIPSLIKHCIEGKDFPMTKGDQTREFNYIDDIIEAYLLAAKCSDAIGKVLNIGNGIEYSIKDVAIKIVQMMGNPIKLLIGALPKRAGEARHFFCNNKKAKKILGWYPKTSLEEGLKKTINWYKNFWEDRIKNYSLFSN